MNIRSVSSQLTLLFAAIVMAAMVIAPRPAQAQEASPTIHAILGSDTADPERRYDRQLDLNAWVELFEDIKERTDIKVNLVILQDDNYSSTAIMQACNGLPIGPNDAVFFACNGHGFINPNEQTGEWPALFLQAQGDKTNLELSNIHDSLAAKNPRLLIVTADVCSSPTTWAHVPPKVPVGRDEDLVADRYTQLFVQARGRYISSGSQKWQPTWTSSRTGSFYTNELKTAIYNTVHDDRATTAPSWDTIFTSVCSKNLFVPSEYEQAGPPQVARYKKL